MAGYVTATAALAVVVTAHNDGHFVFPLDDPYIHASIARNLVEHGVWGVSPLHYASASSSPAWTLLLAGLGQLGADFVAAALAANLVIGALLCGLFLLGSGVHRERAPGVALLGALFCTVGLTPVTLIGMEPVMFAACVLALLLAAERCGSPAGAGARWWAALVSAGLLTGGTRYESMGIGVGLVAGVWFAALAAAGPRLRRPAVISAIVAATIAVPITAMGLVNLAHGEHFFPNSVEAKTTVGTGLLSSLFSLDRLDRILAQGANDPLLMATAAVAAAGLVAARRTAAASLAVPSLMVLAPWAGMVVFGDTALVRYTFFLYVLGALIAVRLVRLGPLHVRRTAVTALAAAVMLLAIPGIQLVVWTPRASAEIYRQQFQMAQFLHRFHDHDGVALNDIGAVSYTHDGDVLDLLGLGSFDVLMHRKRGDLSPPVMSDLASRHDVQVAVIYRQWFEQLPADWRPVESWCFSQVGAHRSVGGSCVTWLGVGDANALRLRRNLDTFRPELPGDVVATPLDANGS